MSRRRKPLYGQCNRESLHRLTREEFDVPFTLVAVCGVRTWHSDGWDHLTHFLYEGDPYCSKCEEITGPPERRAMHPELQATYSVMELAKDDSDAL